uniref:UTP-monosaccharide-1-phosphate uridylyltransferase n=1 Tax=Aplanochytrium stocchinoi TaxID=215587 RepID=A0A6S8CKX9_9STRA
MDQLELNKDVLPEALYEVCKKAASEWGQQHLFSHWPAPGDHDDEKVGQAEQLNTLNHQYPGGLGAYVKNAKQLLQDSLKGVNPFDGFAPSVPTGERLQTGSPEFRKFEVTGIQEAGKTAFIIVAGGLGERLGYSSIKLGLPTEILTGKTYLQLYCENVLALQSRARELTGRDDIVVPLAIMTSGDTHSRTVELLKAEKNFGLEGGQLTIVKQEKVPALTNNDALFAQKDTNPYKIQTKPHGHGDVHSLLYSSGLVESWVASGKEWLCFLQDTNGLVFRALPAAIGVSKTGNYDVNSLTVPRKPGEAVGGICKLTNKEKGIQMTINVEYNQLDPLLRATVNEKGDTPDATGFSPFPGNINVLVFKLPPYLEVLTKSKGSIPEFVNPKYTDETKTKFTKPTRLECMMQDYPKLLVGSKAIVGFTQMDRFICFSAVKNNIVDAAKKQASTGFAESAASGESDMYQTNRMLLEMAGCKIKANDVPQATFAGIKTPLGAKVVLAPSFGMTIQEIEDRLPSPHNVRISDRSSLVLDGDITIHNLTLDGHLHVKAPAGSKVIIKSLTVKNDGVTFDPISEDDNVDEIYAIRGYVKRGNTGRVIEAQGGEVFEVSE